jgi:hypothetical protein
LPLPLFEKTYGLQLANDTQHDRKGFRQERDSLGVIKKPKTGGILQGYGLTQKCFKQGNATGRKF